MGHRRRISQDLINEKTGKAETDRQRAGTQSAMEIYREAHDPGLISVKDYVRTSFKDNKGA